MTETEKRELERRLEKVSDRLSFTEETHTYVLDGNVILPSVTQILKPISNLIYGGVNESLMIPAQERGTAVHGFIEHFERFNYKPDSDDEYYPYFQAYLNFRKDNPQHKPMISECMVFHDKYLYAGRIDTLTEDDYLIDFKTSSEIYLGYTKTQLCGYAYALEMCIDYMPKGGIVLHLRNDGTYFPHKFTIEELKTYLSGFLSCMKIRQIANERWVFNVRNNTSNT